MQPKIVLGQIFVQPKIVLGQKFAAKTCPRTKVIMVESEIGKAEVKLYNIMLEKQRTKSIYYTTNIHIHNLKYLLLLAQTTMPHNISKIIQQTYMYTT